MQASKADDCSVLNNLDEILESNLRAVFVIFVGGGSPHDCAKGIGIVASNGGKK